MIVHRWGGDQEIFSKIGERFRRMDHTRWPTASPLAATAEAPRRECKDGGHVPAPRAPTEPRARGGRLRKRTFCHLLNLVVLLGATRHPRTSSCWCFAMRSPCPAAPTLGHAWTGPTARSWPHCSTAADEGARPSPSPRHTIRRRHRRLDADGPGSSRKRSPRTGEDDPLCVIKDRRGGRGRRVGGHRRPTARTYLP